MSDQEEEKQPELAEANSVRVLETNVLHGSDVLYWLDATSADTPADMLRLSRPVVLNLSAKPRDLKMANAPGRTALWRNPTEDMIDGYADQSQRTRPALATFAIAGEVHDPDGRFNPRTISLDVGDGNGAAIELYPSLVGTRIPPAGALRGRLRYADSDAPVAWALLTVEVTVTGADTVTFRAQADGQGDFLAPLHRLPPLPASITDYDAVLRLTANPADSSDSIPDHATFAAMELESTTQANDFLAELPLTLRHGEVQRVSSFSKDHIAVQPA